MARPDLDNSVTKLVFLISSVNVKHLHHYRHKAKHLRNSQLCCMIVFGQDSHHLFVAS
jgi:hypothetical protein